MPVGLQLVARPGADAALLALRRDLPTRPAGAHLGGSVSTAAEPGAVLAATAALLRWNHRRGGPATCLLRLRVVRATALELPPAGEVDAGTVATAPVVSELRGNVRNREIGSDFAGLATAARARILPAATAAQSVIWYAHHGEFSSYDPTGPETLTRIPLRWARSAVCAARDATSRAATARTGARGATRPAAGSGAGVSR